VGNIEYNDGNKKTYLQKKIIITGAPAPGDALAIPSPFCPPEQQLRQQRRQQQQLATAAPYSLSQSPPPCAVPPAATKPAFIPSGFLMHGAMNTGKSAAKTQRKSRATNSKRQGILQLTSEASF
jgi:hypothetical protein